MSPLAAKLPPLRSLVAFEACARHLNMTRAARELGISREAVSRHIRTLEAHLGVKLFRRLHRALEPTPTGLSFQAIVEHSFENIAAATTAMLSAHRTKELTISTTIAIGSFWLTPRLASFRQRHADVEIHVKISDAPADLVSEGIDVALRYGDGSWKGVTSKRLFGIKSFPLCSPAYLRTAGPIEKPADLLKHTLVNLDGAVHAGEDWRWWLGGMGVRAPSTLKLLGFDSYANVIQAALDGQGVALGFTGLANALIESGQLVRPIESEMTKDLAVYLLTPAGRKPNPTVDEFIRWIVDEAAKVSPDGA